jgi:GT2 family glycosyltransferase
VLVQAAVIIPVLAQRNDWLRQAVLSAVRQSEPTQVIVVVSPLTPQENVRLLAELEASEANVEVATQPTGTGFARAFNVGIQRASAERVGFLLSDDWLDEDAVARCLEHSADIISTGLTIYAADGATCLGALIRSMEEYGQLPTLELKAAYLKHFLLFRKQKLDEVGGVDESIGDVGPDDFDLPWTLLESGASAFCMERPAYNYRDHFGQRLSLRERDDQVRDLEKILDKHLVAGAERESVIARHSQWYGAPIHVTDPLSVKSL